MKQKIGILTACFILMSYLGISPVLTEIAAEFPQASVTTVQLLITLPSLMTLIFSLVAGRLVRNFYKRDIILCSMGCFLAGGLLPLLYHGDIWFLLFCCALMGIGCGSMTTTTAGMICDYYEERERSQMMGLKGAMIALGGTVFPLVGGILASLGWQMVYLVYLLLIPCFVIVIFTLPKGKLEQEEAGRERGGFSGYVCFLCIIGCVYYICQNVFNTNISMYMGELGQGAAQRASVATAVCNFAGIFSGIFLGKIMGICRQYTVPLAFALTAAGMLFTFAGGSLPMVLLGSFCIGISFAAFTAAGNCLVSEHVAESRRSMSIALLAACMNIGATVSPIVVNGIAGAVAPTVRMRFLVAAIFLTVLSVLTTVKFAYFDRTANNY